MRNLSAPKVTIPDSFLSSNNRGKLISTQMGFGQIINDIGKAKSDLADRIVTTSPDVTVSTNLGGWVNRRGLFSRVINYLHFHSSLHKNNNPYNCIYLSCKRKEMNQDHNEGYNLKHNWK